MVLTQARYFLRLESGERVGEAIPIPAAGLKVGRRPDNDLQIADSSVSGRHAELAVDGDGVTLRDLGSTNGTRVGPEKITERRLVHGDDVAFGHVKASFVDGQMLDPGAPAPSAAGAARGSGESAGGAGEAVRTLGTERVASTGKRGMLGLVLLLVLVAGAGGAAWAFLRPGAEEAGGPARSPVVAVAGNLLADPSFEGGSETWEPADAAPTAFERAPVHRRSGDSGLGADLLAGEWARASSPAVKLRPRKALALSAAIEVAGDAEACVGVELAATAGDLPAFVAWDRTLRDTDGFVDVALVAPALPGYDQARVVVEARGTGSGEAASGSVALDDVALVEMDAPPAAATFEDDSLHLYGEPARTAALVHATEVVLAGLRLREGTDAGAGPRWGAGTLTASATGNGVRLGFGGAGGDAVLAFTAQLEEPTFVATMGPDGFRPYGGGIEDVRATSLLLGGGTRLLRLGFAGEVAITATPGAGGLRVEITLAGEDGADLQLSFREERLAANDLAVAARDATRTDPGAGLAAWSQLLDEYPFQTRLVAEAEAERARLLQAGHAELNALREAFERARFFGLADLFRRTGDDARALAERYAKSEVEAAAQELAAEIRAEREELEASRREFERERLRAVLDVIERQRWTGLAERVRGALDG
jgi:hypothetical protein